MPGAAAAEDPVNRGALTHAGAPRAASMMRAISTSERSQPTLAVPSNDSRATQPGRMLEPESSPIGRSGFKLIVINLTT